MAKPARNRKNHFTRQPRLEQLETRRVFAGLVFDSVITTENLYPSRAYGYEAVRDSQGNTYASGLFDGTVDFDRTHMFADNRDILTVAIAGQREGYLAKYNPQGMLDWVRQIKNPAPTYVTIDGNDQPILHLGYSGNVTIGDQTRTSQGLRDVLLAKFSDQGALQWMQTIGTEFDEWPTQRVVADSQGRITVMVTTVNGDLRDLSVKQFLPDGSPSWQSDFGVGDVMISGELLVASDDSLILSGKYLGQVDIDPTSNTYLLNGSADHRSDFIAKFTAEGTLAWATSFRQDSVADSSSAQTPKIALGGDGSLAFIDGYRGGVSIVSAVSTTSLPNATTDVSIFGKIDLQSGTLLSWQSMNGYIFPRGFVAIDGGYAIGGYTGGSGFDYLDGLDVPSLGGNDGYLVTLSEQGQADWVGVIGGAGNDIAWHFRSDGAGGVLATGYSSSTEFDFDPTAFVAETVPNVGSFVLRLQPRRPGTQVKMFEHDFEPTNWSTHWVQDNQLAWSRSLRRSTTGNYSAEFKGSASNATLTTSDGIDLTGLASATLSFDWLIESTFDSGEYLALDISTDGGLSWINDVRRLNGNVSAENVWHSEVVDLAPYMTSETMARFRAKANRSDERANVDNVRIVGIVDGPNTPPIANAGSGYVMNEGGSITLSGAGSSDPDGNIVSYAWDLDGDGLYDDASGISPVYSTTTSGSHVIGLLVTDNRGATATTTTTVLVNNVAPTANAGGNRTGSIGQPLTLSAAGSSDPGQDIVSYLWDLDNDGLYDDADGISAVFTSAVAGAFAVGLKVTDADGAVGFDSLTITITSAPALSTKFYVVDDSATDRTFEYSADGTAIENYGLASGNTAPRGAASTVAGDKVWVVDANKRVYIYDDSGMLLGSWTPGSLASNAAVEGITTNGTDIWLVDNRRDRVYRYAGAASRLSGSQNAASSFALNSGNRTPKDLVTDGNHIWVVNDNSIDRVFKYTMSGSLVGSWTIDSGNSQPTGITIDPSGASQSLWIVDNGTDRVYEYTNARGRNSGGQSAAVWFALAAGNGNPQGIADPPPAGSQAHTTAPSIPATFAMTPPVVDYPAASMRLISFARGERIPQEQPEALSALNTLHAPSQRLNETRPQSGLIALPETARPQSDRPSQRIVDAIFADGQAFEGFDGFDDTWLGIQ